MLDTPPQLDRHLHMLNACEQSCSKMSKTEYDCNAIIHPAYDAPYNLCNIRGNKNIQQPKFPPNNSGRPMRQFKYPLAWLT